MSRLDFTVEPGIVAAALLLLVFIVLFSVLQWQRSGKSRPLLFTELLRFVGAAFLALLLLRPEWVNVREDQEPPVVVVLEDVSKSMETRDVSGEGARVLARREALTAIHGGNWPAALGIEWPVAVETFPQSDSESAGTNLSSVLEGVLNRGRRIRAVLLASDGDWTEGGNPIETAAAYRARGIPIHTLGMGSSTYLPDLALEDVRAPAYALASETLAVPFRVQNRFPEAKEVAVRMEDEEGNMLAARQMSIPAGGMVESALTWLPGKKGEHLLRITVEHATGETSTENNTRSIRIDVREERLEVLVVDAEPRWEFRYLRNAIQRDPGVNGTYLLFHPELAAEPPEGYLRQFPATREEIGKYDVIFLGDVGMGPGQLTGENLEMIRGLVEQQASGVVFMPGIRGRQIELMGTGVDALLPVEYDRDKPKGYVSPVEAHMMLSSEGRRHLLTMLASEGAANESVWRGLPGFQWCAPALRARAGAEVLAVHSELRTESGRVPLLVTKECGNGKSLFLGTDGAWRWRRGVEDRYHYRFWGQVIRWMAHQRHLAGGEGVRLSYSPENPKAGDMLYVQATMLEPNGFPSSTAQPVALLKTPEGEAHRMPLQPVEGGWGLFQASLPLRSGGVHALEVSNTRGNQKASAVIPVAEPEKEPQGRPANLAVLRDIAQMTGGTYGGAGNANEVIAALKLTPEPRVEEVRIPLWSSWWAALAGVFLFSAYWIRRKMQGQL